MSQSHTTHRLKTRLLVVAALVLAADQWTKWLIEERLPKTGPVEVIPGFLNLIQVSNTGVAFGLFPAHGQLLGTILLTVLGLVALSLVTAYFLRTPPTEKLLLVALSLILGGAVGNLVDRVMRGSVTDFLDVHVGTHHWPTFNVADSAISVGLVFLAIEMLRPVRNQTDTQQQA